MVELFVIQMADQVAILSSFQYRVEDWNGGGKKKRKDKKNALVSSHRYFEINVINSCFKAASCPKPSYFYISDHQQTVVNLTLMAEVTVPEEESLSAPYLSTEKKRHHQLSMALPMDCVVSTSADESVRT